MICKTLKHKNVLDCKSVKGIIGVNYEGRSGEKKEIVSLEYISSLNSWELQVSFRFTHILINIL